jgi:hypothetical protein
MRVGKLAKSLGGSFGLVGAFYSTYTTYYAYYGSRTANF